MSDLLNLEPWPDTVHGPIVLDGIVGHVNHHIVADQYIPEAVALYSLQTWALDVANIAPRLLLRSPVPRCGKTTLINMMSVLCRRPHILAEITRATLVRALDDQQTVLIDEADLSVAAAKPLFAVLHSGHDRGSAFVSLMDRGQPRLFSTFGPVVFGSIGSLNPTLMDRCVTLDMKRSSEKRAKFRIDRAQALVDLSRQCGRWAQDYERFLTVYDPPMPDLENDRTEDNWRLMIAIADICGGHWPQTARDAAVALTKTGSITETSEAEMLLQDIFTVWGDLGDRAKSSALVSRLKMLEGRPWDSLNPTKMAGILKVFADGRGSVIKPDQLKFGHGVLATNTRGYERWQFKDAFARYCAPVAPVAGVAGEKKAEAPKWNLDKITAAIDSARLAISAEAETAKAEVCPSNPDPELQTEETGAPCEPARPDVIELPPSPAPEPAPEPEPTQEAETPPEAGEGIDPKEAAKRAERLAATAEVREIIKAFYDEYPRVSVERDKADIEELQGRIDAAGLQISDANLMTQIRDLHPLKRGPRPQAAATTDTGATSATPEAAE